MSYIHMYLAIIVCLFGTIFGTLTEPNVKLKGDGASELEPTVMIATLIRNKQHVLPWFLYYIQNLDYPKNRVILWIRSDHNHDGSISVVQEWLQRVEHLYQKVDFYADESPTGYSDEKDAVDWSTQRFTNVISLRQNALDKARILSADYLLLVDADNFLTNPGTLRALMEERKTIVAPMLNTTASTLYSNFWCGMDKDGYYLRTPDYIPIVRRHQEGCYGVALVHSTLLINLRHPASQGLAYSPAPAHYAGPYDDIIILAHSAREQRVVMHVVNRAFYGWVLAPVAFKDGRNSLEDEAEQFIHLKIENIVYDTPLQKLDYIQIPERPINNLQFDQIYLINLKRRPDRRAKMLACLAELGFRAKVIDGVDGKELNDTYLEELGVHMLPEYSDPYGHRPVTMGEVGCFLSHYIIWKDVVENNYSRVLLFEDDVRFEIYFRQKLRFLLYDLRSAALDWELIYLGRKRLGDAEENWVEGTSTLVWPAYTYWTLSYLLSQTGAQKLLAQRPLAKLVPVDEYLPIMFDRHPESSWKAHFSPRNLIGLSAEPLLAYPVLYTGEVGYVTDTEDSQQLETNHGKDEL